jgi:hypothetical protein
MGERVSRARAAAAPPSGASQLSKTMELERLVALRDRGAITDDEYAAVKRELLAGA